MKRYSAPVNQNEVAAVFVNEKNENVPSQRQQLCITSKHGGKLTTIHYTDSNCDPLVYPLFFPRTILQKAGNGHVALACNTYHFCSVYRYYADGHVYHQETGSIEGKAGVILLSN